MTRRPRSPLLVASLLGLFFVSVYLLSGSSDLSHNGDTTLRYQTTQSIVDHHRLWIAHPVWHDARTARGRGGHLYAFYAPGQTIFMVPLYVLGKFAAHHLSLPYDVTTEYSTRSLDLILGALLVVLFFFMAMSVGYSVTTSGVLTLIFGLASTAWPDAQSGLEQAQVNLFLLLAVLGTWSFVKGDLRNRWWLVLAGSAAGLAVFTRYDAALYLIPLAAYPVVMRWLRREVLQSLIDAAVFSVAMAPWLLVVALWDYARFGSPFLTGLHEKTLGEPMLKGLAGLTVSPGKGVIWYLPLVFLLPWAVARFYRRNRSLAIFLVTMAAITLSFYSNVLYWHGDPAWGPRYLYVIVPYLILPIGEIISSWRARSMALRAFVVAVVAGSLLLQFSAVAVSQWRDWYRIQGMEETTSRPFVWGSQNYHYYWQLKQSPILLQVDNLYQVTRLQAFGTRRYFLSAKPDVHVASNPAQDYPINTLLFWWADDRHPLLGAHKRAAIAGGLGVVAMVSILALLFEFGNGSQSKDRRRVDIQPADVSLRRGVAGG